MILFAVAYAVIGVGFGLLASSADTHYVRLWMLAAWSASAVVAAGQVGYEHSRVRSPLRSTALYTARAVTLDACGLPFDTTIHSRLGRWRWPRSRRSSPRSCTKAGYPPSWGVSPP